MKKKERLARKKLRKSLIFALFIGFLTIGGGLAISLPAYFQVQRNLKKDISKLVNLTSFMSELTTKLGISPDEEFVQELENGYTLVFSNGETFIYKKGEDDQNTLIMNMNKDGSVGSAANFTGVAAKGIIEIIEDANQTLSKDTNVMNDIINNFKDETQKRSFKIESVITGLSYDELEARNLLANNDKKQAQKDFDNLQKRLKAANKKLINQNKIAKVIVNTQKNKHINDPKALQKLQDDLKKQLNQATNKLKDTFKKSINNFWAIWKPQLNHRRKQIKDKFPVKAQMIYDILDKSSSNVLLTWLDTLTIEQLKEKDKTIDNLLSVIVAQAKAQNIKNKQQMQSGNNGIIDQIVQDPKQLFEVLILALGYKNENDLTNKKGDEASKTIENKILQTARQENLYTNDLNDLLAYFKKIGNYQNNHLTKRIEVEEFFVHKDTSSDLTIFEFKIISFNSRNQRSILKEYFAVETKNNQKTILFDQGNVKNYINQHFQTLMSIYDIVEPQKLAKILEDLRSWFTNNPNIAFYQNEHKLIDLYIKNLSDSTIWDLVIKNKINNYLTNEKLIETKDLEKEFPNYFPKSLNIDDYEIELKRSEDANVSFEMEKPSEDAKLDRDLKLSVNIKIKPKGKYQDLPLELEYKTKLGYDQEYFNDKKRYFLIKHNTNLNHSSAKTPSFHHGYVSYELEFKRINQNIGKFVFDIFKDAKDLQNKDIKYNWSYSDDLNKTMEYAKKRYDNQIKNAQNKTVPLNTLEKIYINDGTTGKYYVLEFKINQKSNSDNWEIEITKNLPENRLVTFWIDFF